MNEQSTKSCCHRAIKSQNEKKNNLRINPKIAIFGIMAKNIETTVGAPSYTSGDHIWNGAAASLNNSPEAMKVKPTKTPLPTVSSEL